MEAHVTNCFRITLAQLNPTVGDLQGNLAKALQAWEAALRKELANGRAGRRPWFSRT